MTHLSDLVDLDELEREVAAGYVQRRKHPEFPHLRILNYTDKAQYAKRWNGVTRRTRGLVYNHDTGTVLARPFAKFFNFSEHDALDFDLDAPILGAFDKFDGSLGIAYPAPDGSWRIATRGSFESEQALHATAKAHEVEHLHRDGWTAVFEIVYPANRIVLDYGDRDELVPLGWVNIVSGEYEPAPAMASHAGTLRDVLASAPRPNAEGLVAWLDGSTAVKFKQDDYLALHRAVFSLSAKEVWRQLRAGTYDAFVQALPDEFHAGVRCIADELHARFSQRAAQALDAFERVRAQQLPTMKDRALWLQEHVPQPERSRVFSQLTGRDIAPSIWDELEPKGAGMTLE